MTRRSYLLVVVSVVLLAGCAGADNGTAHETPTETPTPEGENLTEIGYTEDLGGNAGDVTVVYDSDRDVYCYVHHVRGSSKIGTTGGISCLPADQIDK